MSCFNDPRDKKKEKGIFYGMAKRQKRILKPQRKKANATKQHHKLYLFISLLYVYPPFYSHHNNNSNNGVYFFNGGSCKGCQ